jgi:Peptidase family C25
LSCCSNGDDTLELLIAREAMMTGNRGEAGELVFNGLNGATGEYWFPSLLPDVVAKVAQGERLDPLDLAELKRRFAAATEDTLAVVPGVDRNDLAEAGWGVIFPHDIDPSIPEALSPLLEHRRAQASVDSPQRFRLFLGADAQRPGESHRDFLIRQGVLPESPVSPDKLPYNLLVVGEPERIPFRFQYGLDVNYSVGRIAFETKEEYARYAESVVRAETQGGARRRVAFFGARNPDDRATPLSADHLVLPLVTSLRGRFASWVITANVGDGAGEGVDGPAFKEDLRALLRGPETPALLFSATHGMAFPNGDLRQTDEQGALICQDWTGPREWGRRPLTEDVYVSGEDAGDASPAGMVAFLFACYGAGTPATDDFVSEAVGEPASIAPHAFLGRLPQRLLGHPKGGALAVVGHVERAWSYSFLWPRIGEQLDVFDGTLGELLSGMSVGSAVEAFNDRYASLTAELDLAKEDLKYGALGDPVGLSGMWTAKNDARNYVILGDPAVRIGGASGERSMQ